MSASSRVDALAAALERHAGRRVARLAPDIMLDLLRDYYALVHIGELETSRERGLVVRIARELEQVANDTADGRRGDAHRAEETGGAAGSPERAY